MIKDFTNIKTKNNDSWCRLRVIAPDGRFQNEDLVGGLSYQSALHEAKQLPKTMIINIFDSQY